jgi:DNA-binding transcriptional MerR regulator
MSQSSLTIGLLASQAKTNVPTIRYYEDIGLLPPAQRAANGHRYYMDADLKRLTFIKHCRDFGFPIEQVRQLVGLFEDGDRSCIEVRDLAKIHLETVRQKLKEIRQLEKSLATFVNSCDEACSKGPTRHCAIIEDLSSVESDPRQVEQSAHCCGPSESAPMKTKAPKRMKSKTPTLARQ